jgi:hypothetical protein
MVVEVPSMHFVYFTSFSDRRERAGEREITTSKFKDSVSQSYWYTIQIEVWSENYMVTNENLGSGKEIRGMAAVIIFPFSIFGSRILIVVLASIPS